MESNRSIHWPRPDFSRTPSAVFRDRDVYLREQERIFCGPVWCYLALEAEIPHPGDFKTCFVGDRPVVVSRAADGSIHAFVNRCSHRGTTVIREERGNRMSHTCVYHQWTYDATGALIGVPFEHGVTDKMGMPEDFDRSEHGLRRLATESYQGLIFGTFDPDGVEPLHDYLDEPMRATIDRLFGKPIEVLGYMRQRIPSNWKLYWENLNDGYHSGLLHQMFTAFGLARNTQPGGAYMDKLNRHNVWRIYEDEADVEDVVAEYSSSDGAYDESLKLLDGSIVDFRDEVGDGQIQAVMRADPRTCDSSTRGWRCQTPEHDADHGETDEGDNGSGITLEVASEAPVAADPGERSLHDPAFRQGHEAVRVGALNDFQLPAAGRGDGRRHPRPLVAAVGEDGLDEGERTARGSKQLAGAVAILRVGGMDDDAQQQAECIDEDVALAPRDLLARIDAGRAKPPFLRSLGALAVDHRRRWAHLAPFPVATAT